MTDSERNESQRQTNPEAPRCSDRSRQAGTPAQARRRSFLKSAAAGLGALAASEGLALGFLRRPAVVAQGTQGGGGGEQTGNPTQCTESISESGTETFTGGPGPTQTSWTQTYTIDDCNGTSSSTFVIGGGQTYTTSYTVWHPGQNTTINVTKTVTNSGTPTQGGTNSHSCDGNTETMSKTVTPLLDDTVTKSYTNTWSATATFTVDCDDRSVRPPVDGREVPVLFPEHGGPGPGRSRGPLTHR